MDIFSRDSLRQASCGAERSAAAGYFALARARRMGALELTELIEASGLAGKGGAAFPVHQKLKLMQQQPEGKRVLVVNGAEHEPGSLKDRYLLDEYPQTVIEGALIHAIASGAGEVRIAVNLTNACAIEALNREVKRLTEERLIASDENPVAVWIVPAPDSYIVGDESALLEFMEGREPKPRRRPPFPIESGLFGRPTLVQNVETVAHLPYLVVHGSDAYRTLGVNGKGVTLCTFGEEFERSGVQLVPLGGTVRSLIAEYGGGLRNGRALKAVQPGGPSAGYLTQAQLDVPFDAESLAQAGSALGCAAIRGFSFEEDMVAAASEVADLFAKESCGQCPQCRMETQMLSNILRQTMNGKGTDKLLRQIPLVVKANVGKGICGLIKMPVAPVLTALNSFPAEFADRLPAP